MDSLPRSYNKQACKPCRLQKIRCYAAQSDSTTCARCASRKLRCEFPLPRKRGPKSQLALVEQPDSTLLASVSLFEAYFTHPMYLMLPVLHHHDFATRLQNQSMPGYLLCSLMLLSLRTLGHSGDVSNLRDYVVNAIQRQPVSEDALRAHLLYALSCVLARDVSAMYVASGVATRMACLLNLHKTDLNPHDKQGMGLEAKRRLWWCCFLFDRTSSVISGLGIHIDVNNMCVRYPNELGVWDDSYAFPRASPMFDVNALFSNPDCYNMDHLSVYTRPLILFIQLLALGQHVYEYMKYGHVNCGCAHCTHQGYARDSTLMDKFTRLSDGLAMWSAAFKKLYSEANIEKLPGSYYLEALYNALCILLCRTQLACSRSIRELHTPYNATASLEVQRQCYKNALNASNQIVKNAMYAGHDRTAFPCLTFYVMTAGTMFVDALISPIVSLEDKHVAAENLKYCRMYLRTEAERHPHNRQQVTGRKNHGEVLEYIVQKRLRIPLTTLSTTNTMALSVEVAC